MGTISKALENKLCNAKEIWTSKAQTKARAMSGIRQTCAANKKLDDWMGAGMCIRPATIK